MTDPAYDRKGDVLIERLSRGARRWLPFIAIASASSVFVSCLVAGFTVTGWEGRTPASRFGQLESTVTAARDDATVQTSALRHYVDSGFSRLTTDDSIGVAERTHIRAESQESSRMMEDLLVLTCTNSRSANSRLTEAICDRYLVRRGLGSISGGQ